MTQSSLSGMRTPLTRNPVFGRPTLIAPSFVNSNTRLALAAESPLFSGGRGCVDWETARRDSPRAASLVLSCGTSAVLPAPSGIASLVRAPVAVRSAAANTVVLEPAAAGVRPVGPEFRTADFPNAGSVTTLAHAIKPKASPRSRQPWAERLR